MTRAGISRGCWDRACKAHLKPRAPCHNCSYLSVGGEWIPSMNNRLSMIFLGEPRPPILQLISGFLTLLIYGCIFLWERETRVLVSPLRLFLCPVKNCKMLSGSWKPEKCQWGKMSQSMLRVLFSSTGRHCHSFRNRQSFMTGDVGHMILFVFLTANQGPTDFWSYAGNYERNKRATCWIRCRHRRCREC